MDMTTHKVIVSSDQLRESISDLADTIYDDYIGHDENLVFLIVANGALHFGADLLASIGHDEPHLKSYMDIIKVQSYNTETNTQGEMRLVCPPDETMIEGANVITVDDIFDSGETLHYVTKMVRAMGAATIEGCMLLSKQGAETSPKYVGHYLPSDAFVYGYGLDLNGMYRNLPEIMVVT